MTDNQQGGTKSRFSTLIAGIIAALIAVNLFLIITLIPRKDPGAADAVSRASTEHATTPPLSCPVPPQVIPSSTESEDAATGLDEFTANEHFDSTAPPPGMRWIPGGTFRMGTTDGEGEFNEHPIHSVTLNGFFMDTTEVTQKENARVMGANPSYFKDCPDCPVENVTWTNAAAYCKKTGKRLPTEAEWEYAARGGSTSLYYWGDDMNGDYLWYTDNSAEKTHPVGLKKPNEYGLYDMIGNVWEWCNDWYDSTYYSKSPAQDPAGPQSARHRVFRGGSWLSNETSLHSAHRDGGVPESRGNLFGFRCAKSLE
jgi:formylglycine-generating enzyme required for sulfatase activity